MSARSTTAFFKALEDFESEIRTKLNDLKLVAENDDDALRRPVRLAWLDELKDLEEEIVTQIEFNRSAPRLDAMAAAAEAAADSLEAVISRAEDLAVSQHGYAIEAPKQSGKTPSRRPRKSLAKSGKKESSNEFMSIRSPLKPITQSSPRRPAPTPKHSIATKGNRNIKQESPTPSFDDIGLSAATLSLLRRRN